MDFAILREAPRREEMLRSPLFAESAAPAAICCFLDLALGILFYTPGRSVLIPAGTIYNAGMNESLVALLYPALVASPLWGPALFVMIRATGTLIPPVPGLLIDTIGLLLFPWWMAFILSTIGIVIGYSGAFYISRNWREPITARFPWLYKLEEWRKLLPQPYGQWGFAAFRLVSIPVFDYISYAAGMTHMRFSHYFWGSFIATVPAIFTYTFLGERFLKAGIHYLFIFLGTMGLVSFFLQKKFFK